MTVTASKYQRKPNELYETEEWATRALMRCFPLIPGARVWEPAAGNHKIADELRRRYGLQVITSDITVHHRLHDRYGDFLISSSPSGIDAIITNPPYGPSNRLAVKFVEAALERCDGMIAMLLTSKFDFGSTRTHLFRDCPRFAGKIALIDRVSWVGNDQGGTEDHAWFVWTRGLATPRMFWVGNDAKGR